MRVVCGLKLRTYLYLLSGGLEAEHDTWCQKYRTCTYSLTCFDVLLNQDEWLEGAE